MSEDVKAVQLLARGVQDVWLTGDPQVSFYRSTYRRHEQFAADTILHHVPLSGTVPIQRKGDLLGYMFLTAHDLNGKLVPGLDWSTLIDKVDLVIGHQTICSHDITYLNTIRPTLEASNWSQRLGRTEFQPLGFFTDNLPFPLSNLRYTDIDVDISIKSQAYRYRLWTQQIFLSDSERKWFDTTTHRLLIPQVQRVNLTNEPSFHGPIKYIAWPSVNYSNVYSSLTFPKGVITGGTLSTVGGYKVYTFTNTGPNTMTVTGGSVKVQVLLVAGGGGSGGENYVYTYYSMYVSSGGGGGGVYYTSSYTLTPGTYTVNVGKGGNGYAATNGGNSNIYVGNSLILYDVPGGGAGSQFSGPPQIGGSGGGGYDNLDGALGISPYGNKGGTGGNATGGGGGGGSAGVFTSGGNGRPFNISGTTTYYGAGGGGWYFFEYGPTGLGGNGPNSGGGGIDGGNGASGIVIISEVPI